MAGKAYQNRMKLNVALTVDVETDWGGRGESTKGIEEGLPLIEEMLGFYNIRATFFVSAEVIKDWKSKIRVLADSENEIASHSLNHNLDHRILSRKELSFQIRESKRMIEDSVGIKVLGFRTPRFRFNKSLFSVLREAGYTYDSSLRSNRTPYIADRIKEIPVPLIPVIRIPYGFLWLKLLGMNLFKILSSFERRETIILYLHPFDIISEMPSGDFNMLVRWWYCHQPKERFRFLKEVLGFLRKRREFVLLKSLL
jgi:peptidoglycan/xylan/chitin deacetylase (PgdA/CDA1 family)